MVMIATTLPGVLVGQLDGELADRWDRKRILVAADLARALLMGATGMGGGRGRAQHALAPRRQRTDVGRGGIIQSDVDGPLAEPGAPDELTRANAMNQLAPHQRRVGP